MSVSKSKRNQKLVKTCESRKLRSFVFIAKNCIVTWYCILYLLCRNYKPAAVVFTKLSVLCRFTVDHVDS